MRQQNFLVMVRASKLLAIMATMAMMLWSVGPAGATITDRDNDGIEDGDEDADGNEDGDQDDDRDGVEDENDQGEDEQ
jgi:hypothetical protein